MMPNRRLRVAMVTSDFPPASGGIAQWALGVTNELCRLGHSVTVYAQAASIGSSTLHDAAPFRVIKMIDYEWTRLRSTWAAWYNLRIMAGGRFDVVIATHWALGATAVALGGRYPARTVIVLHGSEVLRRRNWFEARKFVHTLKRASLVMAVSGAVKKRVIETTGVDRIAVIHNGIEPARFSAQAPDAALRTQLGLDNRRIILTVARVTERKGQDTVIRALPRVLERHRDAAYLIVGGGPPGPGASPEVNRLGALAQSLGVADRVRFAGAVDNRETIRYYNLADVFAMVSRDVSNGRKFEGFGISLLEAGACERPVVAGNSGGMPEVIEDGRTGLLVDPNDERDVADKICWLFDHPEEARGMGRAARERVERSFSWTSTVQRMLEALP